jgi:mRNA interferase RelE/StbE
VYKVELRRNALKALDKIQPQERSRISSALLKLEQEPRPRGVEKIRNTELWRIREGDYRIVYNIEDNRNLVTIVKIGHRREIYRRI